MSRKSEEFEEQLRKDIDYDDMRTLPTDLLERNCDVDTVNRFRDSLYRQESRIIRRMTERSGTADEMEKYRATKGDYEIDAREFALHDNVAWIYFNYYGENFEGGEIMDNDKAPYECPGCHLKYGMTLKQIPERCLRCGWLTPLGRLIKDGVLRR